jgi:phosphoribosylglycinamide formyltransferase-1
MRNLVLLISGRGSNMVAIARACIDERWPARIAAVVCNRPDAPGLAIARELGLHTEVVDARRFTDRSAFDTELARVVDRFDPMLVILAGFMRILGQTFVERYAGRMINVHPSLLPAFPGLDTHRRALEAGVHVHGATVHLVTPVLDAGPILAQAAVPVMAGDDAVTLGERVRRAEHRLYPQVVRWIVEDRLWLSAEGERWNDASSSAVPAQWLWYEG